MFRTWRKFSRFILMLAVVFMLTLNLNTLSTKALTKSEIAVDPGHGGYDPGVVYKGIVEKIVSLDVSKKLRNYLDQFGYKVVMTRQSDKALNKLSRYGSTMKRRDLNARVRMINNDYVKLFVSIHVNSSIYNKSCTGSIVYYDSNSKKSKLIAESIQKSLNNLGYFSKKRLKQEPRPADFFILRKTKMPGVLVETAFVSNKHERKLLESQGFKNKLAYSIALGIKLADNQKPVVLKKIIPNVEPTTTKTQPGLLAYKGNKHIVNQIH